MPLKRFEKIYLVGVGSNEVIKAGDNKEVFFRHFLSCRTSLLRKPEIMLTKQTKN